MGPAPSTPADPWPPGLKVEAAPEWTELFNRRRGWTGADGIFSVSLDGREQPCVEKKQDTLFWFSDTFVGNVHDDDTRAGCGEEGATIMVNNSRALYRCDGSMDFNTTAIVPNTPASSTGDWCWLGDGVVIQGKLHILTQRLRTNPSEAEGWQFQTVGVVLLTWAVVGDVFSGDPSQIDAPLFSGGPDSSSFFGAGIMSNTKDAGAPHPDGFIYVYGVRFDLTLRVKFMLASRTLPEDFEDFDKWLFWDGAAWATGMENASPVTDEVSDELSVTALHNGKFALVFQWNTLGAWTCMKIGDSPVGPWSQRLELWNSMPEYPVKMMAYNSKAHPHLSKPGTLLVSVNYNACEFADHFKHAGIYRPRFFRISWEGFCEEGC
mmetsp:Transcript_119193/g.206260  ORF Transcript_119193/g.206260 Transcript_119193/m.206260 type:complete len:378 (-) Transcript_119193:239-1372(-)